MKFRILSWIALGAMLSNCVSCNRIAATSLSNSEGATMEHDHFPAHWPDHILAASERLVTMMAVNGDVTKKEDVPLEKELLDLFRWLPELTADSDLNEEAFNKIDQWSARYVPLLDAQIQAGKSIREMLATDGISNAIGELKSIVDLETERRKSNGLSAW